MKTCLAPHAIFAYSQICATEQDLGNLQKILNARALSFHLRKVVRILDQDSAARMQQNFDLDILLRAFTLAVQAFASAAWQERV